MRQTREELERELAELHAGHIARAELLDSLHEFALIPLPSKDQWEAYERTARIRLAEVAKGLMVLATFRDPLALAVVSNHFKGLTAIGLGYDPDPAALPKQVADSVLSVAAEGGRPTPTGEYPYPPFIP